MTDTIIDRPEPPRITKAAALDKLMRERGIERGNPSQLARLCGVHRQTIDVWVDGDDIPELYARRLKDVRPAWFEATTQAAS